MALVAALVPACDLAYPEVAVVNRTGDQILVKDVSFSGCVWETVLAVGETTSPGRCLPGADHVHFRKLDLRSYSAAPQTGSAVPLWFNYQTVSVKSVDYGSFQRFEITLDDLEQDFSTPGPYGH